MRKYSMVLAATVVAGLAANAIAAESNYWFDIRDNSAGQQSITTAALPFTTGQGDQPNDGLAGTPGAPSGGNRGCGQVLRICPVMPNNLQRGSASPSANVYYPNFDGDRDSATGDLNLFVDVNPNADSPLGFNDVISSIGLNMAINKNVATQSRFGIDSAAFSWTITDPSSPVNYGFAAGTPQGTNGRDGVLNAKYVKVPVNGSSLYATAGGLVPTNLYQIGRLRMTAGPRNFPGSTQACSTSANTIHLNESTFNVFLSINNLLITRTFSTGGNATPDEQVAFGYTGGALDTAVSGNTVGGAGVRDAVVRVQLKGDINGTGHSNAADANALLNLQANPGTPLTQVQRYCYDRDNNGVIGAADASIYLTWQGVGISGGNSGCP